MSQASAGSLFSPLPASTQMGTGQSRPADCWTRAVGERHARTRHRVVLLMLWRRLRLPAPDAKHTLHFLGPPSPPPLRFECGVVLGPHRDKVTCLLALPGPGGGVASAGAEEHEGGKVRLWRNGRLAKKLKGHSAPVLCMLLLADGTIVTGSQDKTMRLWSADGARVATLAAHDGAVQALCALTDAVFASGSADRTVRLWRLFTPRAGAESARRGAGACGHAQCTHTLAGHEGTVMSLVRLPGDLLASAATKVRLWAVPFSEQGVVEEEPLCTHIFSTGPFSSRSAPIRVASLRGGLLASTGGGLLDYKVYLWRLNDGGGCTARDLLRSPSSPPAKQHLSGHCGDVTCLAALPQHGDAVLASGSQDKTVRLWSSGGRCLNVLQNPSAVLSLLPLPRGMLVAGCGAVRRIGTQHGAKSSNGYCSAMAVWGTGDGQLHRTLDGHKWGVTCLVALVGGEFASASSDVRLWL